MNRKNHTWARETHFEAIAGLHTRSSKNPTQGSSSVEKDSTVKMAELTALSAG
jgi:hypothetical protein